MQEYGMINYELCQHIPCHVVWLSAVHKNQYFRANITFWVRDLVVNDIFGTSLASVGKTIKILSHQHKYLECCSLRHPEKKNL